jgi:hypothetical protein
MARSESESSGIFNRDRHLKAVRVAQSGGLAASLKSDPAHNTPERDSKQRRRKQSCTASMTGAGGQLTAVDAAVNRIEDRVFTGQSYEGGSSSPVVQALLHKYGEDGLGGSRGKGSKEEEQQRAGGETKRIWHSLPLIDADKFSGFGKGSPLGGRQAAAEEKAKAGRRFSRQDLAGLLGGDTSAHEISRLLDSLKDPQAA